MVAPGYKTFVQMSREATLVPVAKTLSADLLTPVGAFLSVAVGQKYSFLLESVEGGERIGRYTFVGAQPRMVVTARGKEISIRCGREFEITQGHVIDVLRRTLREHRSAQVPGLPPFTGGGVGYFAYDLVRQFERLPETAKTDVDLPDCIFTFYDRLLAFDHLKHQLHIIALADVRSESPRKASTARSQISTCLSRSWSAAFTSRILGGPPLPGAGRSRSARLPAVTNFWRACVAPRSTLRQATSFKLSYRCAWISSRRPIPFRSIARCAR